MASNGTIIIMQRITCFLLVSIFCAGAGADHQTPETVVREITEEVLARLKTGQTDLNNNPERLQQLVRELIIPHFYFDTMSRLALGRYWKYLDEDQRRCFTGIFRSIMVERYAHILLSYDQQAINYQPAEPVGNQEGYVNVVQEITLRDGSVVTVEYPMRPLEDGWKVTDLVIDHISLVRSNRNAYQEQIRNDGLDVFLDENVDCVY